MVGSFLKCNFEFAAPSVPHTVCSRQVPHAGRHVCNVLSRCFCSFKVRPFPFVWSNVLLTNVRFCGLLQGVVGFFVVLLVHVGFSVVLQGLGGFYVVLPVPVGFFVAQLVHGGVPMWLMLSWAVLQQRPE